MVDAVKLESCLVTGGSGFLGRNLVCALLARGCRVTSLDLLEAPAYDESLTAHHELLTSIRGNVCNYADVVNALNDDVDTVFHAAAVLDFRRFMPPQQRNWVQSVITDGTENVIRACQAAGVKRLIYTSSDNVSFRRPPDTYTRGKLIAEAAVLAANSDALQTCALRPSGIYGPGETMILGRLVSECQHNRLKFKIDDGHSRAPNSYIENALHGHLLAADTLTNSAAHAGKAYFVNDGVRLTVFEYFKPLIEGMGFNFPTRHLPAKPLQPIAFVSEIMARVIGQTRPLLALSELARLCEDLTCDIKPAERDFGYQPKVSYEQAMSETLPWCLQLLEHVRRNGGTSAAPLYLPNYREQSEKAVQSTVAG